MSKPEIVLKPRQGIHAIPIKELIEFRDLFWTLAMRDVKLRYRQTALGAIWVVLQPILGAGIFAFVFGSIAGLKSGDTRIPYFIFSFASLLCWNTFNNIFSRSSDAMVANAGLISKIYFPRMILALSGAVGVLIDFAIALGLLIVLMLLNHISFPIQMLLMPAALAMTMLLALGLGLCATSLMVSYRDVKFVVPVITQFLMWGSPVAYAAVYAVKKFPAAIQEFYSLNPLVGILEFFRWTTLGIPMTSTWPVYYSAAVSIVAFFVGALVFTNMERRFADVV